MLLRFIFFFFGFSLFSLSAQTPADTMLLTPQQAVSLALAHNFDVRIINADADIARLNNTRANAGMTPVVNLNAAETFTVAALQQSLSNGNEISAAPALSNTLNAAVVLNWTLFDGRRMQLVKKRLEAQERLGQTNTLRQAHQTAATVLAAYYDVAAGRAQERALEEIIAYNEERLKIAQARLEAGFAAQTDALQAGLDLNQRKTDLLLRRQSTQNAHRALNLLLARDPETPFSVEPEPDNTYAPDRAGLPDLIMKNNAALQSLQQSAEIAALQVKEAEKLGSPRIVGVGQISGQRADNGAGFFLTNNQAGTALGATFTMPLYTGGNLRRQADVAQISAQQALLRLDAQKLTLQTEAENLIAQYQTQKAVLELETQSVALARQNLNISTERFRLGQTNGLEVQAAQNGLEQTLLRQNVARFALKSLEIRLRLLSGQF